MRRFGVLVIVAATAAGGCASPARYVERKADSGIVAVLAHSDDRGEALKLIEKHVGPNYEIIDERTVPTGRTARTNPRMDTDHTLNARNPAYPAKRPTTPDATAREDVAVLQITYRKKVVSGIAGRGDGFTTADGTNGLTPNVRPAGGLNSAFNRNTAKPASGGADCNH